MPAVSLVPDFDKPEIEHFFQVYKNLQPNKSVATGTWVGRGEAETEIQASYERAEKAGHHGTASHVDASITGPAHADRKG